MNCFNHPETSAVGSCKACSKGLCPECAEDLGHGIACKNLHEQQVEDLRMVISKNIRMYKDAGKNQYIMPIFFMFMGLVYSGYCLYQGREISSMPVVLGIGFILLGVILIIRNRRIFENDS